jgi:diguanylate cyclase (GGDEF)-like protein/PAS domain S-box-containing protein
MQMEVAPVPDEKFEADTHSTPTGLEVQKTPIELEFFKGLLDYMSDGVYVVDRDRRFLYCNEAAIRMTGYKAEEIVGQSCQDRGDCPIGLIGPRLCLKSCLLTECMKDGGTREAKTFLHNKEGRRVPVAITVQAIRAPDGSIVGAVEILKDDSAQNEARRKLDAMERLAFLDSLTQMPNRRFLEMTLHSAMREYQVAKAPFGVLVIDLDGLKIINDTFGHASGDNALKQLARTLAGTLRPTDTVGRWSGDEFLAIVHNVNDEILRGLAERCAVTVARISCSGSDGQSKSLSISVGGTVARPRDTFKGLIKRADGLMYESKTSGRDRATIK